MYYIYHIPGVKIGCSDNPKRRVKAQKYDYYEILETHIDINIASNREIELQKQYGYKVDRILYSESKRRIKKAIKIAATLPFDGTRLEGAKLGGRMTGTKDRMLFAREHSNLSDAGKIGGKITGNRIHTCPHCQTQMKGNGAFRWHFDNCKLKVNQ
jgi:hypothetical protein